MQEKRRHRTQAQQADKYELYEKAVQMPEVDAALVERLFRKRFGRPAHRMREDFCGTAIFACEWVRRSPGHRAWAIDLDAVPLRSGRRRHAASLTPAQAARLQLIQGDVLRVTHEPVDVTVAFNFSYFLFPTRDELRRYFESARAGLAREGLLLLDAYGGADAQRVQFEPRKVDGFVYIWDQHAFDPISHAVTNYIHFQFRDGSRLHRAFRYDWRLWTLPEIRELLGEAGFRETEVYWEGTDRETLEGNGVFRRCRRAPHDPAWICYIAAWR
jgi:hypothetical protein